MTLHQSTQRRRGGARNERGAALVEFALVAPLLILLVFGAIEYGFFFKDYLTMANTSRSGARVGSAAGSSANADYQILQSIKSAASALPGGFNSLEAISVYRSTAAGGPPPAACTTGPSAASKCNFYTKTSFSLPSTSFGCTAGAPDAYWCPTTRVDSQSAGPDYVGVYVKTTHGFFTTLFGSSRAITDSVVMRVEPKQA